jgi:hypothetical protein
MPLKAPGRDERPSYLEGEAPIGSADNLRGKSSKVLMAQLDKPSPLGRILQSQHMVGKSNYVIGSGIKSSGSSYLGD